MILVSMMHRENNLDSRADAMVSLKECEYSTSPCRNLD